jgi:hypothetical protein
MALELSGVRNAHTQTETLSKPIEKPQEKQFQSQLTVNKAIKQLQLTQESHSLTDNLERH